MTSQFEMVTSADGTRIALERRGDGPPVILIGGAYNDRTTVAGLAAVLADRFTTIAYDRRSRGDSSDNRAQDDTLGANLELDDVAALIAYAGGSASLFGHSSGGVLALEAGARGQAIDKIAVYEPPFIVSDESRPRPGPDLLLRLRDLLADGRVDETVALFQTEAVGLPPQMVEGMRQGEIWVALRGLAHSLPYDEAIFDPGHGLPIERLGRIAAPTLAIAGSRTFDYVRAATRAVAEAIPRARYLEIDGEDHGILHRPEALRDALFDFLS